MYNVEGFKYDEQFEGVPGAVGDGTAGLVGVATPTQT